MDDWGFAGFPLNKETDAADRKNAPPGRVTPKAYAVNPRPGIVISDSQVTAGAVERARR